MDGAGPDGTLLRGTKRQKLSNGAPKIKPHPGASKVFAPYRTVGLVSPTAVPFTSVPLGKTTFQITTSVGRSLQTYDLRKGLNTVFITVPQTPSPITASVAWKDKIYAAYGGEGYSKCGVWVFRRGKKEAELQWPSGFEEYVQALCIFGGWIVGVCQSQMLVWKTETHEIYTQIQGTTTVAFSACISSLPTFLNKIIIGKIDGSAEIWNIASGRLVYSILSPSPAYGAVTTLAPTPALGLVAIAYANGAVVIQDIKADRPVIALATSGSAAATSITFRTDGIGAGDDGKAAGVMATASTRSGDVTLWDLNDGGRKVGSLRSAHGHPSEGRPGGVSKIEFLAGQAIMVSTGLDNSLKTWTFDRVPFSPVPRILHERRGHGAPISRLLFLPTASDGSDDTGKWLISASQDRSMWGWSLRRDGQSTELSQGAVSKKAKKQGLLAPGTQQKADELRCHPITSIACSLNRDGGIGALPGKQPIWQPPHKSKRNDAETSAMTGWESVLTAHEHDNKARTWFWGRKRAGRWAFGTSDASNVASVAISPCGTFAFVGSEKGGIDMFNLQSGVHRQRFPARLTLAQARHLKIEVLKHGLVEDGEDKKGQQKFYRGQGRHTSSVVGLAVDSLNKTLLSAGKDGRVKFWALANGMLQNELDWSASTEVLGLRLHRSSELAGIACRGGIVRVVDITTYKLVRELKPSRQPMPQLQDTEISDFCFSADGKWVAACFGRLIMLWDLLTGHLVDVFKLSARCSSLAFSPTAEYLATATTNSVGVDIWSNKTLFTRMPARHIGDEEVLRILTSAESQATTVSAENAQALLTADQSTDEDDMDLIPAIDLGVDHEIDQLSSDLVSLSVVPRSRWQNLLHLDLIRQRNKPTEPPKKPEKAPFFLPSLSSQRPDGLASGATEKDDGVADVTTTDKERSRIMQSGIQGSRSTFTSLLHSDDTSPDYAALLDHLKGLNPAAADIEIRALNLAATDSQNEGLIFVRALIWLLGERRDFELGQAWMSLFLKLHGDAVSELDDLRSAVDQWQQKMAEERMRIDRMAGFCGGVVTWLRAARV